MKKIYSFLLILSCSSIGAFAGDILSSRLYSEPLYEERALSEYAHHNDFLIGLARKDIDITLSGRSRQEGFLFDKSLTFRDDYNDTYSFMRSKINLDTKVTYGKRTYSSAAVEAGIRLTAFNVWDNVDVYVPTVEEPVYLSAGNFLKRAEISKHHHDGVVTHFYLEDGWLQLNAAAFEPTLRDMPVSLKVGYFPYLVGRGVALGDYFDGAVQHLGWKTPGNPGNGTQRNAGALLQVGPDRSRFEFFYSRWRNRNHGPDLTREEVKFKRLDIDENKTENIQRGVNGNRHLMAARFLFKSKKGADVAYHVEPYLVYVRAPELEVEFEGDASANMGTFGVMSEFSFKNFTVNIEMAGQFGEQVMHPIDRNHLIVGDSYAVGDDNNHALSSLGTMRSGKLYETYGSPMKYNSHILLAVNNGSEDEYLPYRSFYSSQETKALNSNRTVAARGKVIIDPETGAPLQDEQLYNMYQFVGGTGVAKYDKYDPKVVKVNGTYMNADIPFGGGRRFRDRYTLSMRGKMLLLDASYRLPSGRGVFGFACGHISGDAYPFNEEKDKTYKGFVPFKDANYTGRSVRSYAMFGARKLGRPAGFSDSLMHSPVTYESATNLNFIGCGVKSVPLGTDIPVRLEMNLLSFWQDVPPYAWDKEGVRTFGDEKLDGIYKKAQSDLHFSGARRAQRASSHLGYEINAMIAWRPIQTCEFSLLSGMFLPGQLYKDSDGMPHAYTIRRDRDGEMHFDSMGSKAALGAMLRLTLWF